MFNKHCLYINIHIYNIQTHSVQKKSIYLYTQLEIICMHTKIKGNAKMCTERKLERTAKPCLDDTCHYSIMTLSHCVTNP